MYSPEIEHARLTVRTLTKIFKNRGWRRKVWEKDLLNSAMKVLHAESVFEEMICPLCEKKGFYVEPPMRHCFHCDFATT